jgi:hypothetical protein
MISALKVCIMLVAGLLRRAASRLVHVGYSTASRDAVPPVVTRSHGTNEWSPSGVDKPLTSDKQRGPPHRTGKGL